MTALSQNLVTLEEIKEDFEYELEMFHGFESKLQNQFDWHGDAVDAEGEFSISSDQIVREVAKDLESNLLIRDSLSEIEAYYGPQHKGFVRKFRKDNQAKIAVIKCLFRLRSKFNG